MVNTNQSKDYDALSLKMHEKLKGKLSVVSKYEIVDRDSLAIAYTPGVAEPCRRIHQNKDDVYKYTIKGNTVAVVTDGTAVLGLGDIGPEASIPVMEGKAALFKKFAGIDAFPIAVSTKDVDEFVNVVKNIAPVFGGINLEDISAPRCFEIEEKLNAALDIPVFHDDQHGTAIVVLAGLINALKLADKKLDDVKIVFSGAGAAAIAITKLLFVYGAKNIILSDRLGAIYEGRVENMNSIKESISKITNMKKVKGKLKDVLAGADVFIGVSSPNVLDSDMVKSMNSKPIIFALANPTPEIMPDVAKDAGAFIVATGRSDFPNQVNNVLVFPGIFKGALSVRAKEINNEMKIAAAIALSNCVTPAVDNILPKPFDKCAMDNVSDAVKNTAIKCKLNRI